MTSGASSGKEQPSLQMIGLDAFRSRFWWLNAHHKTGKQRRTHPEQVCRIHPRAMHIKRTVRSDMGSS